MGLTVPIKMRFDRGQAGVIANAQRDLHRIRRSAQIRAFRLRVECVSKTAPELDSRLQTHATDNPFKGVRPVPTPLERSGCDSGYERADLKFDRFRCTTVLVPVSMTAT